MKNEFNVRVGEKVREARLNASMSQSQLAEKVGFTKQWVSAKELGIWQMSLRDTILVSEACNVPISFFDVGVK